MAFIVPGVCRYTVNQLFEGRLVANILDMRIDTTGAIADRDTAVADQAEIILDEWDDSIRVRQVDDLSCTSVSWVDLDDASGTTGDISTGASNSWPAAGAITDPPEPGGVSVLVQKRLTGSARDRRNGRLYLCGISNSQVDTSNANLLASAYLTDFQTQFDAFFGDINQNGGGPLTYESALCVVHILTRDLVTGAPLTGNSTDVDELVVDPAFAYQRRRAGR